MSALNEEQALHWHKPFGTFTACCCLKTKCWDNVLPVPDSKSDIQTKNSSLRFLKK